MAGEVVYTPSLAERIAATPLSEWLKEQLWILPTSQSIHIVALSVVFISGLVLGLRLLGALRSERPLSQVIASHTWLIYVALGVLLFTGSIQTVAEPDRQFGSPAYLLKMPLVALALGLTVLLARSAARDPGRWDRADARPAWSRAHAVAYLATWVLIIVCGRFIGYT